MDDLGYDLSYIYELNKSIFIKSIIKPNNRNTKNKIKKRKLNESEEQLYKKRIKVEYTNQKIKAYRILIIYMKNISKIIMDMEHLSIISNFFKSYYNIKKILF